MSKPGFVLGAVVPRRGFLAASTSSLLFASRGWCGDELVVKRPSLQGNPFSLGVASGDPNETSLVIWTRLAPKPLEAGGGMPLADVVAVPWEVAEDEGFTKIVRRGESVAVPQLAHSVHVEVKGLEPDRWYWYRFHVGSDTSPVGRGRTMPAPRSAPEQLRFAFASCQHYETGLYTAYEHMAREELDLVLHLGDYIYEGATRTGQVREHTGDEIRSLDDYRIRHALYKTDAHLQAAHARFPWAVTWDDHEFDNNYATLISEESDVDPAEFRARRTNAYQAYYEHMPLRHATVPTGPHLRLYRRLRFGQLAEFNLLDTRQYRTDQPNGDGAKPLKEGALDPAATLLGERQENWLCRGLIQSPCRWNVLAQQIMMARVNFDPGGEGRYSMDQWSGYDVARRRLLQFLADRRVANPLVLTGDIHSNWCNNLLVDFDQVDAPPVATEFVGTSISSAGNGGPLTPERQKAVDGNPFVKFHSNERGYVRCTLTAAQCRADYQAVPYVDRPGAPLETRASFVVQSGHAGAVRV